MNPDVAAPDEIELSADNPPAESDNPLEQQLNRHQRRAKKALQAKARQISKPQLERAYAEVLSAASTLDTRQQMLKKYFVLVPVAQAQKLGGLLDLLAEEPATQLDGAHYVELVEARTAMQTALAEYDQRNAPAEVATAPAMEPAAELAEAAA